MAYRDSSRNISLNFANFPPVTESFILASKLTLLWYAENMSQSHLMNLYGRFEHFLKTVTANRNEPLKEITSLELINFRATLGKRDSWYLGSLSGLLKKWHELGYPGVTDDAIALLNQLRILGNIKGEAVLTMDPENGPFTDIEVQAIHAALDKAMSDREISRENYLLVYLYMLLGQRTIQYAALKVCDITVTRSKDGTPVYTLRIPRAKQRNQLSRTEFKDRVLIPKIGEPGSLLKMNLRRDGRVTHLAEFAVHNSTPP